jgi:DNA-binding protein H-NS
MKTREEILEKIQKCVTEKRKTQEEIRAEEKRRRDSDLETIESLSILEILNTKEITLEVMIKTLNWTIE